MIIGKSTKAPLSKAQQAFNRLVKRIEKLRRAIDDETDRLNRLLTLYTVELHPLELRMVGLRKTLVRRLYPFLKSRGLSGRRQREALKTLISEHLIEILEVERELRDPDLKSIADELRDATPGSPGGESLEFLEELKRRWESDLRDLGL